MAFNHKVEKSVMINPMSDTHSSLRNELEESSYERYVPTESVTATRWVEIARKKWKIERKDPYGFWYVSSPDGSPVPEKLSSKYTNAKDCQRAIEHYVNVNILEVEEEAPETSRVRRRKTELPAVETVEVI